jgi:subtilase family serine protease
MVGCLALRAGSWVDVWIQNIRKPAQRIRISVGGRSTIEFGARFGADDATIQAAQKLLESEGFTVEPTPVSRLCLMFSGTAGAVKNAFEVEVHRFQADGVSYEAPASTPRLPASFATVAEGVLIAGRRPPVQPALTKARIDPKSHRFILESAQHSSASARGDRVQPLLTSGQYSPTLYGVTPGDLGKLYSVPFYAAGGSSLTGTGVTVGVVSDSNVNLAYVENYQRTFSLPANTPTVVVDGTDPGITGAAYTVYEQLELIAAVAPHAAVNLYTASGDGSSTGEELAVIRALADNAVQVLVFPYEACEAALGLPASSKTLNQLYDALWESAAAQGITVVAAAGDSGASGCDAEGSSVAALGLAVNGVASTPYSTAVGGTDFYYGVAGAASQSTYDQYWGVSQTSYTTALGYIPEQAWNDSDQATDQNAPYSTVAAGGGGLSTVGLTSADETTQSAYPEPWWQINVVPTSLTTTARAVPDVALFAGDYANNSAYVLCEEAGDCSNITNQDGSNLVFSKNGGTHGSSAVFAGMMALVVQQYGAQGNANPTLYNMFQHTQGVFNDVVNGTNATACGSGTPNCTNGLTADASGIPAYSAAAGYDAATGLGSINATALVQQWSPPNTRISATTLALVNPTTGAAISTIVHGQPVEIKVAVTVLRGHRVAMLRSSIQILSRRMFQ